MGAGLLETDPELTARYLDVADACLRADCAPDVPARSDRAPDTDRRRPARAVLVLADIAASSGFARTR